MLRSARQIIGWTALALGGSAGIVRDLLVDDQSWQVRHLTIETLPLAHVRNALVSPRAVRRLNDERQRVELTLEQWQVAAAPDIEYDPPIAVQQEQAHYDTVAWRYWQRPSQSGEATATGPALQSSEVLAPRTRARQTNDPNLRSVAVMTGYPVIGHERVIGTIDDFVLDDESWRIGCLVIAGHSAMSTMAVEHIVAIDWTASEMHVDLTELSPATPYDADNPSCRAEAA